MVRSWPVRMIESPARLGTIGAYGLCASAPADGIIGPSSAQTNKEQRSRPNLRNASRILWVFRRARHGLAAPEERAGGRALEERRGGHRPRLCRDPIHVRQQ